jgi:hypothetical protein
MNLVFFYFFANNLTQALKESTQEVMEPPIWEEHSALGVEG